MSDDRKICKECIKVKDVIVQLRTVAYEEGCGSTANGPCSHAEGFVTVADGVAAHAEGAVTMASGDYSHAAGFDTTVTGIGAHAEGGSTVANGNYSHAEGFETMANGGVSHAEGFQTQASGVTSHAEGANTQANGAYSHVEGYLTVADGNYGHAEGQNTLAGGDCAHAEGQGSTAGGIAAHAEGLQTQASGEASHAEGAADGVFLGFFTSALARGSHAEGIDTTAGVDNTTGIGAHAEGYRTIASGDASHAEGAFTQALSWGSHAEGVGTTASGDLSHAEGSSTTASGDFSHAEGVFTDTNNFHGAHIMGQFGLATDPYSWFLANGDLFMGPALGAKIIGNDPLQPGVTNAYIDGAWIPGGADYAEMFETVDGQPMELGYFVTLDGEKIRPAQTDDDFILGVTSANYSVLGNSGELRWKGKYISDEWGRVQKQKVEFPAVFGKDGRVIVPKRKELRPVLNPAWDSTQKYISRLRRPEWVAVGLVGQVLVRDDGSCQVNGYCTAATGGIATTAPTGYRVLKRTGERQILILLK